MENAFNCKMLTLGREFRGMSQSELSSKVSGLAQPNLSKIEKGLLPISESVMIKVSEKLDLPISFFTQKRNLANVHQIYYRKRVTLPRKALMALDAEMNIIMNSIDILFDGIDFPDHEIPSIDLSEGSTPEDAARGIRNFMGIFRGPISNPIGILEAFGIVVFEIDVNNSKFDGQTLISPKGIPIIFLKKNNPADRKRFTIGHELGHIVMHLPFVLDYPIEEAEREADRFSAEFNMPELDSRNDLVRVSYRSLGHLKSYWKLSKAAIVRRTFDLGMITSNTYKYLMIELSRNGERKKEIGIVDIDKPTAIAKLTKHYTKDLGYTIDELAPVLHLNLKDYNYFFNQQTEFRIHKYQSLN